jgi:pyruvate dehydrogenase phosphatase
MAHCGTASFASNVPREDRDFSVTLSEGGGALVGVIDGHCGSRVAEIVAKDLPKMIQAKMADGSADASELMKQSYLELDAEILTYATKVQHSLVQQGACVLSALVDKKAITVANAGDCGALLVTKDERNWKWLNNFHNAGNPEEQKRLKLEHPDEGDVVECIPLSRSIKSPFGERIDSVCYTKGMLQPTRAIGDWYLKEKRFKPKNAPRNFHPPYLSAEPEIVKIDRTPDMAYLVLATDGLWEILGAGEVSKLLLQHKEDLQQDALAKLLLEECLLKVSASVGISLDQLKSKPVHVSSRNIVDDLTISVVDLMNNH